LKIEQCEGYSIYKAKDNDRAYRRQPKTKKTRQTKIYSDSDRINEGVRTPTPNEMAPVAPKSWPTGAENQKVESHLLTPDATARRRL